MTPCHHYQMQMLNQLSRKAFMANAFMRSIEENLACETLVTRWR